MFSGSVMICVIAILIVQQNKGATAQPEAYCKKLVKTLTESSVSKGSKVSEDLGELIYDQFKSGKQQMIADCLNTVDGYVEYTDSKQSTDNPKLTKNIEISFKEESF